MFFSKKKDLENAAAFLKLRAGVDIRIKCKLKATPLPSIERLREGWVSCNHEGDASTARRTSQKL